jgi:hypothetical protein
MPPALDWLATAQACFADDYGSLRQGLLTSIFSLVIGLERVFHLDDMEDPGCAGDAAVRRGTWLVAGDATCLGTRWMPSAAAPAHGTCSTARTPW